MMQFGTLEREPRPDLVQRHSICLLSVERFGGLVADLEHARNAVVGHYAQPRNQASRVVDFRQSDRASCRCRPLGRGLLSGPDD